jgi:hypothetical protein
LHTSNPPRKLTRRRQIGAGAIEVSKITGHRDLEITGEYTFVADERQNELTRRIQKKVAGAAKEKGQEEPTSSCLAAPEVLSSIADSEPVRLSRSSLRWFEADLWSSGFRQTLDVCLI